MSAATAVRPTAPADLLRQRAIGVAVATLLAAVLWALETQVFSVQILIRFGASAPQTVGIVAVILSSLAGAVAGWGLLTVLERRIARAGDIWTAIAALALLASFVLPILAATTISAKVSLSLLHVAVAGVIIPAFRRA